MFGSLSCKECGSYVAPNSRACPRCGRKRRNVKRMLGIIVGCEAAVLVAGMYWWTRPHAQAQAAAVQTIAADDAVITDVSTRGRWSYYTTHDTAVNDLTRHARLAADAGGDAPGKATLELRDSATYGKAVLISFPTLPRACETNRCVLTAAFDQGPAEPYDFTMNDDAATTTVELPKFADFVDRLEDSQVLAVTIVLGTAKDLVLKFKVAGFTWA